MRQLVIIGAMIALTLATAAPAVAGDPVPKDEETARAALWKALEKAKRKDLVIDAYGENPSLTQVCFSAGNRVYLFTLKDGKVTEEHFMKFLPKINRITFRSATGAGAGPGGGDFQLWANGRLEMTFSR